jgi:glycosyltransferase involved in cell wall biosynthesis
MRSPGAKGGAAPLVSVVLPVYNAGPFLEQALQSISGQTLEDIEIICIDDGSTDGSSAILAKHAADDNRIQIFTQTNEGAGAARNRGLSEACGQFVWFPDADDFYEDQLLQSAVAVLQSTKSDFVAVRCNFYDNKQKLFIPFPQSIRRHLLPSNSAVFNYKHAAKDVLSVFSGWAWDKVYRLEFINGCNLAFDEMHSSNDVRFVLCAALKAQRFAVVEDVLIHHRRNVKSSVSNTREKNYECSFLAMKHLKEDMISSGLFDELKSDFRNFAIFFLLWHLDHLKWWSYRLFLKDLRNHWFKDLDLMSMKKSDFYEEALFDEFEIVLKAPTSFLKVRSVGRKIWSRLVLGEPV